MDRLRRTEANWAGGSTVALAVTGATTIVAYSFIQYLFLVADAFVIDQGPGSVKRCWAQVFTVPIDRITSRVTDSTVDAFDASVCFLPFGTFLRALLVVFATTSRGATKGAEVWLRF